MLGGVCGLTLDGVIAFQISVIFIYMWERSRSHSVHIYDISFNQYYWVIYLEPIQSSIEENAKIVKHIIN